MCFFLLRQTQTAHFILHYLTFFTSQCTPFYPKYLNPLNAELNSIRHLLALVGARHIVHVSRIRVNQNDCKQDLGKCTAVIFFFVFLPRNQCNLSHHIIIIIIFIIIIIIAIITTTIILRTLQRFVDTLKML